MEQRSYEILLIHLPFDYRDAKQIHGRYVLTEKQKFLRGKISVLRFTQTSVIYKKYVCG